jgi:hypothetical protein
MDPECPAISLTPSWAGAPVLLVGAVDAIRLCHEGGYAALDAGQAVCAVESRRRGIADDIREFVTRSNLSSFPLSALDDLQVIKLIVNRIRSRDLVAVRRVEESSTTGEADQTAELRRLVRDIESKTRERLAYAGRQYKLVVGAQLANLPGRDNYQVVPRDEAREVLSGITEQPGTPAELKPLLVEANSAVSPDWRPPLKPSGLVLLCKVGVPRVSPRDDGPAFTPSQIKKLTAKSDWIEIEVVDQDGEPYTGSYHLKLPNDSSTEGSFNEDGFLGDYDLTAGNCQLFLAGRNIPKGSASEAPAL